MDNLNPQDDSGFTTVKWIFAVALLLVLVRLPGGVLVLEGAILNTDETEMTFSVLDRFLGLPSTSLAWPGGTLQLLSLPVVAVDFLCSSSFELSPE